MNDFGNPCPFTRNNLIKDLRKGNSLTRKEFDMKNKNQQVKFMIENYSATAHF